MRQQRPEQFVSSLESLVIVVMGLSLGIAAVAAGRSNLEGQRLALGFFQEGVAVAVAVALLLHGYSAHQRGARLTLFWCATILSLTFIVFGTAVISVVPFLYLLPFVLLFLGGVRTGSPVLAVFFLALVASLARPDLIHWARPRDYQYNLALVITFLTVAGLSVLVVQFWTSSTGIIRYLATTDTVTALPIRTVFLELPPIPRGNGVLVAIRDLATIESGLGIAAASVVRRQAGQAIRSILTDPWQVFQFSDASFIITAPASSPQTSTPQEVARVIQQAISQPVVLDDRVLTPEFDISVVSTGESLAPEELARRLETARQLISRTDNRSIAVYDPILDTRQQERHRMGALLAGALERRELYLAYQPIVDAVNHDILAAEVLLRWTSGELGPVSPVRFVPLAEERGLIGEVTEWVIATAWQEVQAVRPGTLLSFNVSPVHLRHPLFLQRFREVLDAGGIPAEQLIMEITEGVLLDEAVVQQGVLSALAEMGVSIAIDDFGTGYSNIEYLQRFPVQRLKIDRSFVMDLFDPLGGLNSRVAPVLEAMIFMGRSLGVTVICEGVEHEQAATWLRSAGCDALQGYHFGRPRDAATALSAASSR